LADNSDASQAIETPELRLTGEQMAAIIARIQRRKRKIVECGEIDLGDIDGTEDLKSAVTEFEE
jgi:hypothetical protein